MDIKKVGLAGTLESSDIMITVRPGNGTVNIDLKSPVDLYYHDKIMKAMTDVIQEMGIQSIDVQANDHGALDCTIRARMATAIKRAVEA